MARVLLNQQIVDVPEKVANAIFKIQTQQIAMLSTGGVPISTITHPEYDIEYPNWWKWRLTYEGGDCYIDTFTKKFSKRESSSDFNRRKEITPNPGFAKGAITEIKNSIFQRTVDITRAGGHITYQKAVLGQLGGVDRKGATMNWFIGNVILPELLAMKKVGVYIDNEVVGISLAEQQDKHPYFYHYKAENIRSWAYTDTSQKEFKAVLLREYVEHLDPTTGLPIEIVEQFRHVYLGDDGFVKIQFYDRNDNKKGELIELKIKRVPFIKFEITDSLLKDIANHQIALLNLESSDIAYALKSNFPFYTEQYNPNNNPELLKRAQKDYNTQFGNATAEAFKDTPSGEEIDLGTSEGRKYPVGTDRPEFISPSSEPLKVSMEKQGNLKEDIRVLVQLALSNIQAKMASAESKDIDQRGLESGLAAIGLELEHGERKIGSFWAMYLGSVEEPTINYPKQYSLKSDAVVQKEIEGLQAIRDEVPSQTFRKEINKQIARLTIGSKVTIETITTIEKEIQDADYVTSSATDIGLDLSNHLVSLELASKARGYPQSQVAQAKQDGAEMAAAILKAQSAINPAARGVPALGGNATIEKIGKQGRQ